MITMGKKKLFFFFLLLLGSRVPSADSLSKAQGNRFPFKLRWVNVSGLDEKVVPSLVNLGKDSFPDLVLFPYASDSPEEGPPYMAILDSVPGYPWWVNPDSIRLGTPGNVHFTFGDFNEDGWIDIVLLGREPTESYFGISPQVLLNYKFIWLRSSMPELIGWDFPVVAVDLDSDRHIDFAFLEGMDTIVPYWGNGKGEFNRGEPLELKEPWERICVQKKTGSEALGIALLHRDRGHVGFIWNQGPGHHLAERTEVRTVLSFLLEDADSEAMNSLNLATLNDIVGITNFPPFLQVWKSLFPDRDVPKGGDGRPLQGPFFMQKGDLNLDGQQEILFGWGRLDQLTRIAIVSGKGASKKVEFLDLSDELLFPHLTLRDCDDDGDLDFVTTSYSFRESSSRVLFGENLTIAPTKK